MSVVLSGRHFVITTFLELYKVQTRKKCQEVLELSSSVL